MFAYLKNNCIFATAIAKKKLPEKAGHNGEILKRPTRTDCKSVEKSSQVRILLSPQPEVNASGFLFMGLF
jgi:hypothetical protein